MNQDQTQADGYYGEETVDNSEIDLSFLNEDTKQDDSAENK